MEAGRPRLHRRVPPLARVEAVQDHLRPAAGQHRHEAVAHRVHVKARQRRQQPLRPLPQGDGRGLGQIPLGPPHEIRVRQQAPLGPPRGPRGVDHRAVRRRPPCGGGRGRLPVDADRNAQGFDLRHPPRQRHHQRRAGMAKDEPQFGPRPIGVQRHDRHPQPVQRQPVQEMRGPVLQHQRHAMPRPVSRRGIPGAQRFHRRQRGGIGHHPRRVPQRDHRLRQDEQRPVPVNPRLPLQQRGRRGRPPHAPRPFATKARKSSTATCGARAQ